MIINLIINSMTVFICFLLDKFRVRQNLQDLRDSSESFYYGRTCSAFMIGALTNFECIDIHNATSDWAKV